MGNGSIVLRAEVASAASDYRTVFEFDEVNSRLSIRPEVLEAGRWQSYNDQAVTINEVEVERLLEFLKICLALGGRP